MTRHAIWRLNWASRCGERARNSVIAQTQQAPCRSSVVAWRLVQHEPGEETAHVAAGRLIQALLQPDLPRVEHLDCAERSVRIGAKATRCALVTATLHAVDLLDRIIRGSNGELVCRLREHETRLVSAPFARASDGRAAPIEGAAQAEDALLF